ncbi:MAG TPA: hypothetical protein V6D37_11255 [Candidatus Sericytochromatia bacterium]
MLSSWNTATGLLTTDPDMDSCLRPPSSDKLLSIQINCERAIAHFGLV